MRKILHQSTLRFFLVATGVACAFLLVTVSLSDAKKGQGEKEIHAMHLGDSVEAECTMCHVEKPKDKGVLSVFPMIASCKNCHDDAGKLGYRQQKSKRRDILFSHADHIGIGKKCADCHRGKEKTQVEIPDHDSCRACHQKDLSELRCVKCHINWGAIDMKTLSSFTHENDYLKRHADFARKSAATCAQCHTENYCLDCHAKHAGIKPGLKFPEKVRGNTIHRGDYISVHKMEARTDSSTCLKCHGVNACQTCHARRGLSARSTTTAFTHPDGWVVPGSKNHHGVKARQEIVSCASCHNRGGKGDCRTCHTAANGINPHPKNFGGGLSKSHPMCAQCHK